MTGVSEGGIYCSGKRTNIAITTGARRKGRQEKEKPFGSNATYRRVS